MVVSEDETQIYQDDDLNNLLGNYKLARNTKTYDNKIYVVPNETLTNYLKKKEEEKIISRNQRPRAKPVPMQKKDDKKLLTIRDITTNYTPRVSAFTKKAEEDEKNKNLMKNQILKI